MIRFVVGLFIVIGTVGAIEFWDVCYAAADCVAGKPMSMTELAIKLVLGFTLMWFGVNKMIRQHAEN